VLRRENEKVNPNNKATHLVARLTENLEDRDVDSQGGSSFLLCVPRLSRDARQQWPFSKCVRWLGDDVVKLLSVNAPLLQNLIF